jgi:hypothetical protein
MGPEWVKRQGSSHLFGIEAITRSSFLGIEGDQTLTTWDAGKVMKRIQLLGAHEQVGLTDVPTRRGYIRPGPASVGPDEFSHLRSAFILGGEPGPSGQGYIDPSVGNVTSHLVMECKVRQRAEAASPISDEGVSKATTAGRRLLCSVLASPIGKSCG